MNPTCAYVSPRAGIRCQLTASQHQVWGCHMAWTLDRLTPTLKMQGNFVSLSQDRRTES